MADQSDEAKRHLEARLCPFGNIVPNCTKDKVNDPLGVSSISTGEGHAVICPVRFRQQGRVVVDAAQFFFGPDTRWAIIPEVRLKDRFGRAAGNIDMVVVAYDAEGKIIDFGAVEVQAVYISGNIRNPFSFYMGNQQIGANFDWEGQCHYPRPDYLSSSRKRLAPQLLYKGSILRSWGKRLVIVMDEGFMRSLPEMTEVPREDADIAWHVYDFKHGGEPQYQLYLSSAKYSSFDVSMAEITVAKPGPIEEFVSTL